MSWFYSIVFAGMLISGVSDGMTGRQATPARAPAVQPKAIRDVTEKFDQTYPLSANGKVRVSNVNGPIVVEAWDRNEVRVEATKIADSAETLGEVTIKVEARADLISVEADYENWRWGGRDRQSPSRKLEVHFKLSVPRGASLDEVETVNGEVTVSDLTGVVKISAVNGNVAAANLRGTANLSTVNGTVNADFDGLESGSRISLSTVNGSVNLVMPSDANATVKADSLNGKITNDYGLPVKKGEYVGRNLHGRLGSGEVQVRLNSVNGPLSIKRRQDGRPTSPATNLLKPGSDTDMEFDFDFDGDFGGASTSARTKKAIADVLRDSAKETAKAMEQSRVELEKVKPQLDRIEIKVDAEKLQTAIEKSVARQAESLMIMSEANWTHAVPVMRKTEKIFPVKGVPSVTINAEECDVNVRAWDRPEVKYVLSEMGNRRDPGSVAVTEKVTDSSIELTVVKGDDEYFSGLLRRVPDIRIEVFVPRSSNVLVRTASRIRITGVSGETEVEGGDEPIDLRDLNGKVRLTAGDAQIRVIGLKGELVSEVGDGNVYLEGDFDKITSEADGADIILTLPANANVSIDSTSEIDLSGLNAVRENSGVVRIGKGERPSNFVFGGGSLKLRNSASLESN